MPGRFTLESRGDSDHDIPFPFQYLFGIGREPCIARVGVACAGGTNVLGAL